MKKIICLFLLYSIFKSGYSFSAECDLSFADKIRDCEPHACEFMHEVLPIRLSREIVGKQKDKCIILEDMPGNFHLECKYKMSDLDLVADKYTEVASAKNVEVKVTQPGDEVVKSDIKLDGKDLKYSDREKNVIKEACHIYMNGNPLPND